MIEQFDTDRDEPNAAWQAFRRHHQNLYKQARTFLLDAEIREGAVLVDAACGLGYGYDFLGSLGQYVGLDIDEDVVREARRRRPLGNYCPANLDSLPVHQWRAVDVFVSFETAEHLEDPLGFLCTARRMVKDSGVLLFSAPTCRTRDFDPYHRRDWTKEQWAACLNQAGWRIAETRTFALSVPFRAFWTIVPTSLREKLGIVGRMFRHGYVCSRLWEWGICQRFLWTSQFFACVKG